MAAGGPVQQLCEEASCSVCLDFFRDPVIIPECGHTFCRACLTRSWGDLQGTEASCPQCRGPAQEETLRPNHQLANLVEIIQKLRPLEGSSKERGGQKRKRGVCELHQEPLKLFCREDEAPLCLDPRSQEHRGHQEIPLEEASQGNRAVVAGRKGRVCPKHQEPLRLFCKEDEALVCLVCVRSGEHRDHKIRFLEEASPEYKEKFASFLDMLKKERERIVVCKQGIEKESQDLLKRVAGEKQETVYKFRELRLFLEEQENHLVAQMEEVEKEVARKRDQHLTDFSEALSSLDSLTQEMEEKCQQPPTELLQDARSFLQRYEKKFRNPVCFPLALKGQICDISTLNPLLERLMKQLRDTIDSGLYPQKANVTLDPDTARPQLILSQDRKSMRDWGKAKAPPNNPERTDFCGAVFGREGFTGGCHFWEVLVGKDEGWAVGVARKSVRGKGNFSSTPEVGIWAVGKWEGYCRAARKGSYSPLALCGEPKRIRVCLNYDGGQVAFLDADRGDLIYEYSGASFSGETLLPFFWVSGKGHLKLSS